MKTIFICSYGWNIIHVFCSFTTFLCQLVIMNICLLCQNMFMQYECGLYIHECWYAGWRMWSYVFYTSRYNITVLRENYELYQKKKTFYDHTFIANLYHGNSRQLHNDCNHASENSTRCVLLLSHIYSSRELSYFLFVRVP